MKYYDHDYSEALINKSHALFGQKHFVKSLMYYNRAIKIEGDLKNIRYHKRLLMKANDERDQFSKLKLNIYAGDEFFTKGEFERAVESYNHALIDSSKSRKKYCSNY